MAESSGTHDHDRLIERLRERIADPERRLDSTTDELSASIAGLGIADLFSIGRSTARDLRLLLDHGASGESSAKADDIERRLKTPAQRPLPERATPATIAAAEASLGFSLPALLRRVYLDVANGGFGPGFGIVGVRGGWTTDRGNTIEDLYEEMSDSTTEDPRWVWPVALVPFVDRGGSFVCVDATTPEGRIAEWDPDELDGRGRDGGWTRSFREVATSLEAWLDAWLEVPPPAPAAGPSAEALSEIPEVTRQYWASMSAEQLAEYGLPATGWGRVLFGDAWGDDPRDR